VVAEPLGASSSEPIIALIGPSGSGKSRVGRRLAEVLNRPFIDTDEQIVRKEGRSISEIFSEESEAAFREMESREIKEAAAVGGAVVSTGGGAVLDPGNVEVLREAGRVVYLKVSPELAAERVGSGRGRPLLEGHHLMERLEELIRQREPRYLWAAHHVMHSGSHTDEVVAQVRALVEEQPPRTSPARVVRVELGERSYEVRVGEGLISEAARHLPHGAYDKVVVIADQIVDGLHGDALEKSLSEKAEVLRITVPAGEESKAWEVAGRLLEKLAELRIRRHDLVATFGGGMVSDLGGFVASVYQRGVALVHFPTTMLAQVDAAIGGKTGVNLQAGKNLAGTFYQPWAVVADVSVLSTLPKREFRSGMAEVVKYALCYRPDMIPDIRAVGGNGRQVRQGLLADVIASCAQIKAEVVSRDELDQSGRIILNYGHTFGHALEAAGGYRWLHGEAISVGMVFAANLAFHMGLLTAGEVELHVRLLEELGLPVTAGVDPELVTRAWNIDKKYLRGQRWVLLEGLGNPVIRSDVSPEHLQAALEAVRIPS
jgi:shikimate kinase / 3-dehydroquinate synthase